MAEIWKATKFIKMFAAPISLIDSLPEHINFQRHSEIKGNKSVNTIFKSQQTP